MRALTASYRGVIASKCMFKCLKTNMTSHSRQHSTEYMLGESDSRCRLFVALLKPITRCFHKKR